MRITIDFTRVRHGVPRIRAKWQRNGDDDLQMTDLGIDVYGEIVGLLEPICNKVGGKSVVFEDRGCVN